MKSVTMISWEFDPFRVRGGTAYAIRRLADQLTGLGIETRVILPDWLDTRPSPNSSSLLKLTALEMSPELRHAPRVLQCSEFCRAAVAAAEHVGSSSGSDAFIAHSDEGAMFIVQRHGKRSSGPSIFWLHSLYDPPIADLPKEQRQLLPSKSLLASAVMMADVVVTSRGVLKDAREFEWPDPLKELQKALLIASDEQRVLMVESMGCLPLGAKDRQNNLSDSSNLESLKHLRSRYVLFPGRPTIDKGLGIFAAIANCLRADNITCVAVRSPAPRPQPKSSSRDDFIHWLPWLSQEELTIAMRNAICTVLPSITEGFGLAAAESISLGVATLYQQVGGHHGLQALANGRQVPLTIGERAQLYHLWSELIGNDPDSWLVWTRHENSLEALVDKWVEVIRSVVHNANGFEQKNTDLDREAIEREQWGHKLLRRIEMATKQ